MDGIRKLAGRQRKGTFIVSAIIVIAVLAAHRVRPAGLPAAAAIRARPGHSDRRRSRWSCFELVNFNTNFAAKFDAYNASCKEITTSTVAHAAAKAGYTSSGCSASATHSIWMAVLAGVHSVHDVRRAGSARQGQGRPQHVAALLQHSFCPASWLRSGPLS